MDLFNKTFFRFAFGFVGIILFSIAIIFIVNAFAHGEGATPCMANCAHPQGGDPVKNK